MLDTAKFWWGTTCCSTSSEGAAPTSDWARWESIGRAPRSHDGNGFTRSFRSDLQLLADHGLTHQRITLDWSRLEPAEGRHDRQAIEHYRTVLETARELGIERWICLHDVALPGWFSDDSGGFLDERALSRYWPRHLEFVGETFGDLASGWIPMHQPVSYAVNAWWAGNAPPGRQSMKDLLDGLRVVLLANVDAARRLRTSQCPTSLSVDLSPIARRPSDPTDASSIAEAQVWADTFDQLVWNSWLSMVRDGELSLPARADEEVPWAVDAIDLIGVTYRAPRSINESGAIGNLRAISDDWVSETSTGGRSSWSDGMQHMCERLADELPGRRFLVTEIGVELPTELGEDDDIRCASMAEAATIAADMRRQGMDLAGLFWSPAIDGYGWASGYERSVGIFDITRRPRASAEVARDLAVS